jgi:hypothetical protein
VQAHPLFFRNPTELSLLSFPRPPALSLMPSTV